MFRELISDFTVHFMHCLCIFKHASHVLDREAHVEKALQQMALRDGERLLDYRFVDSKSEVGVQVSDVVTGLLGRHFSYLQQYSLPELRRSLALFSAQQKKNLGLLKMLIDRSDAFSEGLIHAVLPWDIQFKNNEFLHGLRAPNFLG